MSISNPRTRTISLRLSEPEFQALKSLYGVHGARSVSEFIRKAMQSIIAANDGAPGTLESRVEEIGGRLATLDGQVARISHLLQMDFAPGIRHD